MRRQISPLHRIISEKMPSARNQEANRKHLRTATTAASREPNEDRKKGDNSAISMAVSVTPIPVVELCYRCTAKAQTLKKQQGQNKDVPRQKHRLGRDASRPDFGFTTSGK